MAQFNVHRHVKGWMKSLIDSPRKEVSTGAVVGQIQKALSTGPFNNRQGQEVMEILDQLEDKGKIRIPGEMYDVLLHVLLRGGEARAAARELQFELENLPQEIRYHEFERSFIRIYVTSHIEKARNILCGFKGASRNPVYIDTEGSCERLNYGGKTALLSFFDVRTRQVLLWRIDVINRSEVSEVRGIIQEVGETRETKRERNVETFLIPEHEVEDTDELLNLEELNPRNLGRYIGVVNDNSSDNAKMGLQFLAKYGFIANSQVCKHCGNPFLERMVLSHDKTVKHDQFVWRCRDCRRMHAGESRMSMRAGTFFENKKFTIQKLIYMAADWIENPTKPLKDTMAHFNMSKQTVVDLQEDFRRMTEQWFIRESQNHLKLGGPNKVVEIDETLVVRAKYNRGRNLRRKQIWVFGLIERGSKKTIMCRVPRRDAATLLPIIEQYVEDDEDSSDSSNSDDTSSPDDDTQPHDGSSTDDSADHDDGIYVQEKDKSKKINFNENLSDDYAEDEEEDEEQVENEEDLDDEENEFEDEQEDDYTDGGSSADDTSEQEMISAHRYGRPRLPPRGIRKNDVIPNGNQPGVSLAHLFGTSRGRGSSTSRATARGRGSSTGRASSRRGGSPTGRATTRGRGSPTGRATTRGRGSPTGRATTRGRGSPTGRATTRGRGSPTGRASSRRGGSPAGRATEIDQESPAGRVTEIDQESPTGRASSRRGGSPAGRATEIDQESPAGRVTEIDQESPTGRATEIDQGSPTGRATSRRGASPARTTSRGRGSAALRGTSRRGGTSPARTTSRGRGSAAVPGTSRRGASPARTTSRGRGSAAVRGTSRLRGSSAVRGTVLHRGTSSDRATARSRGSSEARTTSRRGGSSEARSTSRGRGSPAVRGTSRGRPSRKSSKKNG
ncbi:hypothetical protein CAEBREN_11619 [Caenorhabditis brenneri]|uniref:ISXO2-like transposase domain-containing protein n=1 Tax=Caenorhabditis brenneri TaxID=135651 RepID=G0NZB8_CAEBE|nr:hypothetical protein CAEBREN_11619 [Caenorhabditis brenneri]